VVLVGLEDGLQINPEALEKIDDAVAFPRAPLEAEFVRPAMSGQNHLDNRANVLLRVGAFRTRDQSVSEIVLRPARFERWKKLPAAEADAVFVGDGVAPLRPGNPRRKIECGIVGLNHAKALDLVAGESSTAAGEMIGGE
jgi:hypothetical protein